MYSETHIDVFDCTSGDWLQTLNVKRARPLNISGTLTSCVINDMPYVIYLTNLHQRKCALHLKRNTSTLSMLHLSVYVIELIGYHLITPF